MNGQSNKLHFQYKCKIHNVIYNIQLFNIQQEKIKIMIGTKNSSSDDYIEYSNIYSIIQFQEITKYFVLFQNIDEIFNDLSIIIKEKNFSIQLNENTLTLTIKVILNKNIQDIDFILDKNKIIDLNSQKDNNQSIYYSTVSSKNSDIYKNKFYLEKSKRNVEISNLDELNTLLSDFKDRITVLERSQSLQLNTNNNFNFNSNANFLGTNENINEGLENILMRINKLENDNNSKDKIIEKLENKLNYYESIHNNSPIKNNINNIDNNFKNDNIYTKYTQPLYQSQAINPKIPLTESYNPYRSQNTFPKNQISKSYNIYHLQEQKQPSLFFNKNNTSYNPRLFKSKSEIMRSYNNEEASLHSKVTKKSNLRNSSYNDKKISFRDENRSYEEKDTFKSNRIINDSYGNDINSSYYIKSNHSNLNTSMSNNSNPNNKKNQIFYNYKLGIPIVPREDLKKYVNSRIIFTKKELRLLKNKFSNGNKNLHVFLDLLYRASIDGDFKEIIQNNTEDKEKLLTLFYTYEGSRFGVYINRKKVTSIFKGKIYKEIPGTSFIVSLNNLRVFDISHNKTSKEGIEDYLSFGRTYFLNNNGTNWLIQTPRSNFLKKKCIIGNQKNDYMFFDPEILTGSKNEYHIKDVEIFNVVFEMGQ